MFTVSKTVESMVAIKTSIVIRIVWPQHQYLSWLDFSGTNFFFLLGNRVKLKGLFGSGNRAGFWFQKHENENDTENMFGIILLKLHLKYSIKMVIFGKFWTFFLCFKKYKHFINSEWSKIKHVYYFHFWNTDISG